MINTQKERCMIKLLTNNHYEKNKMATQTKGQLKNKLSYIRRKRRTLLKECIKSGIPLPEEYKSLTHDIVMCEINLSQ